MRIEVPPAFADGIRTWGDAAGRSWLAELPDLADRVCARWQLRPVGVVRHGGQGIVVPVRRDGRRYALKLSPPGVEFAVAARGLAIWAGRGIVRLIEHDLADGALLLEWLDAERSLADVPIATAIPIAGGLIRQLAVPAGAGVPTLADRAGEWGNGGFARRSAECGGLLPTAVRNRAETVCAELGPTAANLMVSSDLHYENILSGPDGNWLAIDPKPVAGDPEFALAPLLWRRFDEGSLPNRLRLLVESGGLDAERAHGWALVHTIDYWLWAVSIGLTEDPKVCASIVRWLMQRA